MFSARKPGSFAVRPRRRMKGPRPGAGGGSEVVRCARGCYRKGSAARVRARKIVPRLPACRRLSGLQLAMSAAARCMARHVFGLREVRRNGNG